jgi:CheY-like chemotaxis protein
VFGKKSRVPIIAITAYVMPGDIGKILDVGMDDYVSKPVNWGEVIAKIELQTSHVAI